jgi:DNA invertase Pin-like site-specific DNA recombinase
MATTITEALPVSVPVKAPVYAFGVVRVSEVGGRDASRVRRVVNRVPHVRSQSRRGRAKVVDTFRSDAEQRERVRDACRLNGWELTVVRSEMDVSGKLPLDKRPGLREAVEAVESGQVKVVIVAYFDRLARNIDVKREVIRRIEAAGGRVFAVDFGGVSHATAVQELTSDLLASMHHYYARQIGERLAVTQAAAISEGLPIGTIPPGYRQDPETFRLVKHEAEARVMHEAFEMRAEGTSWRAIQRYMAERGIVRSTNSVRKLLHSRTFLGELFHGKHSNPESHEPIIDRLTFDRVQRERGEAFKPVPGRKSPLLLAGLRILKCGTCGKSLAAGAQVRSENKRYATYRCNPNLVCDRRVNIDAKIADNYAAEVARTLLRQARKSATEGPGFELADARAEAERAQAKYSRGIRNLASAEDEAEAQHILAELREQRDQAAERAAKLERSARAVGDALTLNADMDWEQLSLEGKRGLLKTLIVSIVVDVAGVDADGRRLPRGIERLHVTTIRDAPEALS